MTAGDIRKLQALSRPDWRPEPALWTVEQAAAYLNVSTTTVWNLLRRKELVRRRIGNTTRIPKTSVENFLRKDHATQ